MGRSEDLSWPIVRPKVLQEVHETMWLKSMLDFVDQDDRLIF
jgi:hypothetical protein